MVFAIPDLAKKLSNATKLRGFSEHTAIHKDITVWILTNKLKPSVTEATLTAENIPFAVYENPDWELPADHPEHTQDRSNHPDLSDYALRQYRAFRGHQEILKLVDTPYAMVFEDDMTLMPGVTREQVVQHINGVRLFVHEMGYDAVCMHAREVSKYSESVMLYGREYAEVIPTIQESEGHQLFLQPVAAGFGGRYSNFEFQWLQGCLAYFVGQLACAKWVAAGHGSGMPCDLFLANELKTIVMKKTLFKHDNTYGSLINNTVRTAR